MNEARNALIEDQADKCNTNKNENLLKEAADYDKSESEKMDKEIQFESAVKTNKRNGPSPISEAINKTEGVVMFIVTIVAIIVCALMLKSSITSGNQLLIDDVEDVRLYIGTLETKILDLEATIEKYQTDLNDKPINITVNVDGINKDITTDNEDDNQTDEDQDDIPSDPDFDTRPFLGVALSEETVDSTNPFGIKVDYVYQYSPAALAGIKSGDIIVSIDGTKITTWDELGVIINSHQAEDILHIEIATVSNNGIEFKTVEAKLTYRGNFELE